MNDRKLILDAFAKTMVYPEHDHDDRIRSCCEALGDDHPDIRQLVREFAAGIEPLSLSDREELYIKTFDLSKSGTLDLGWHLFGEDYNRGLFLVKLRQYLQMLEIPESRELPDHVTQVLRILGRMSQEDACLFTHSCVVPSLRTVGEGIGEENPCSRLVQALVQLLNDLFEVPEGFEESAASEYELSKYQLPIIQ